MSLTVRGRGLCFGDATGYSLSQERDGHIAYQVFGAGDVELVVVPGPLSHLEILWEQPEARRCLNGLGSFARVAIFDRRGLGLSDPLAGPITLEQQVEDLDADRGGEV